MRFVFDTNTLVSAALFSRSLPRLAFDSTFKRGEVLTSEAYLAELDEVLHRAKFTRYLTALEADLFVNQFSLKATSIVVTISLSDYRNQKDNKFLELAVDGDAVCIITGDQDLLVLHPYCDLAILNPVDFLRWIADK